MANHWNMRFAIIWSSTLNLIAIQSAGFSGANLGYEGHGGFCSTTWHQSPTLQELSHIRISSCATQSGPPVVFQHFVEDGSKICCLLGRTELLFELGQHRTGHRLQPREGQHRSIYFKLCLAFVNANVLDTAFPKKRFDFRASGCEGQDRSTDS